jgi:hypothetical protein
MMIITGCGVTIQTGPEDEQRQSEVSEARAKQIRADYATRFQGQDSKVIVGHLKYLVDSVSANYLRYGNEMAREWRNANEGRGTPVSDTEMGDLISRSNQSQQQIYGAYEDVVELGISRMKWLKEFDQTTLGLLAQFSQQFYEVRSTVFYPPDSVEKYEQVLAETQTDLERMSRELTTELRRY